MIFTKRITTHTQWIIALAGCGMISWFSASLRAAEFSAADFGVVADGKTDDGPAILKMLHAARKLTGEPVYLVFPKNKTILATTAEDGYLLSLGQMRNVTIDGNGSTFMLEPGICMADLSHSRNAVLRDFNVDHTISMFVETTIQSMDAKKGSIDIKPVEREELDHLCGPTKQKGEQWFGGFVWCENGGHPKAARHYSVKSIQKLDNDRIRVFKGDGVLSSDMVKWIIPGVTRFSMPRSGVAQRSGPGPLFRVHDATDARLERITVWSAPWFSFSIYRCEGTCEFLDVNVVPKPDTRRLMSGCRDAFHVTANRAKLVFENCDTRGTGDDDYNFCTLSSTVKNVTSPDKIVIRQKFPIQYNPMRVGETLMVMNSGNSVLGSAKILTYEETPLKNGGSIVPGGNCPEITLTLASPIPGLTRGLTVWSMEAANPDTTLKNCTASFSNRIQTSLKIEHCKFTCYTDAYGMSNKDENVEGPGPGSLWISHSEFEAGRGSGFFARCGGAGPLAQTRILQVHIEDSVFHTPLQITKARSITLLNNQFQDVVKIGEYENLETRGNTHKGAPFSIDASRQKRSPVKSAK